MKTQEQSMIVTKEYGFLTKIKNFFKTLVFDGKMNEYSANIAQPKQEDELTKAFGKKLKNTDDENISMIKEQLKKGEIMTKSLSDDQKKELIAVYKKQIAAKKLQLENIKKRISYMERMAERKGLA